MKTKRSTSALKAIALTAEHRTTTLNRSKTDSIDRQIRSTSLHDGDEQSWTHIIVDAIAMRLRRRVYAT